MMRAGLQPFRYRIVTRHSSAIHTFYAPNRTTADRYAKAWARRRNAIQLTRIRKESRK